MQSKSTKSGYDFEQVWGSGVAKKGYTRVPNAILEYAPDIGASASEFQTLVCLLRFLRPDLQCKTAAGFIAKQSSNSTKTVRKNLRSLERKGLIHRRYRKGLESFYSLEPLAKRLRRSVSLNPAPKRAPPLPFFEPKPYPYSSTNKNHIKTERKRVFETKSLKELIEGRNEHHGQKRR